MCVCVTQQVNHSHHSRGYQYAWLVIDEEFMEF